MTKKFDELLDEAMLYGSEWLLIEGVEELDNAILEFAEEQWEAEFLGESPLVATALGVAAIAGIEKIRKLKARIKKYREEGGDPEVIKRAEARIDAHRKAIAKMRKKDEGHGGAWRGSAQNMKKKIAKKILKDGIDHDVLDEAMNPVLVGYAAAQGIELLSKGFSRGGIRRNQEFIQKLEKQLADESSKPNKDEKKIISIKNRIEKHQRAIEIMRANGEGKEGILRRGAQNIKKKFLGESEISNEIDEIDEIVKVLESIDNDNLDAVFEDIESLFDELDEEILDENFPVPSRRSGFHSRAASALNDLKRDQYKEQLGKIGHRIALNSAVLNGAIFAGAAALHVGLHKGELSQREEYTRKLEVYLASLRSAKNPDKEKIARVTAHIARNKRAIAAMKASGKGKDGFIRRGAQHIKKKILGEELDAADIDGFSEVLETVDLGVFDDFAERLLTLEGVEEYDDLSDASKAILNEIGFLPVVAGALVARAGLKKGDQTKKREEIAELQKRIDQMRASDASEWRIKRSQTKLERLRKELAVLKKYGDGKDGFIRRGAKAATAAAADAIKKKIGD